MSLNTRRELTHATRSRYHKVQGDQKTLILNEFIAATGYHRKYALTLLNTPVSGKQTAKPNQKQVKVARRRIYDKPVEKALVRLWEISNHLCSKRLVPFLPELLGILEQWQEITVEAEVREKLLTLSAATCDRLLAPHRRRHGKATTKPGTLLRQHIPIRTYADWNDCQNRPGFCEIDLVAHCGSVAVDEFAYTLTLTDILTGWTDCLAITHRSQACVVMALEILRLRLPFVLLGVDSDNGSEFLNAQLLRYCQKNHLTFTRCRPYQKNDQCFVEQKNWSVVRRSVGYGRQEGDAGVRRLNAVYAALCPFQNHFQPSLKLVSKERNGARVKKTYDAAQTPYRRLIGWVDCPPSVTTNLASVHAGLNPAALLRHMEAAQRRLLPLSKMAGQNGPPEAGREDIRVRFSS